MQLDINQLALTESSEDVPIGLSGDPERQERPKKDAGSVKKAPISFIIRVYIINIIMLILSVSQWTFVSRFEIIAKWLYRYNHWLFLFYYISFLELLIIIFFHDLLKIHCKTGWYLAVILAMETSSTVLISPCMGSFESPNHMLYTTLACLSIFAISILFSIMRRLEIEHEPDYVIVGGIRVFMICSVLNLISQTTSASPFLEVAVSVCIIPFITCFILVCAKTIGTIKFYTTHGDKISVTALSSYYCFLALFSNVLTFFLNIDLVRST